MIKQVLLLSTLETKREESDFLADCIRTYGHEVKSIDVSLRANGEYWGGERKNLQVTKIVSEKGDEILNQHLDGIAVVVALGGGTGGDIVLKIMEKLPFDLPKVLISPMPFDPRPALAYNSVTLIPSIVDIAGLNSLLRDVFSKAAAMVNGLCQQNTVYKQLEVTSNIGLSALSTTGGLINKLIPRLRHRQQEVSVFHANGYGGATFAQFVMRGAFKTVIDTTCHELTRMLFEGDHVPMPTRFTAAAHLPRVVIPGGINFLGLGPLGTLKKKYRKRQIFCHSSFFTHVSLLPEQMEIAAKQLADDLNQARAPTYVIIPMGGFSHSDRPGGDLENLELREICFKVLSENAQNYQIEHIANHINDEATAIRVIDIVEPYI